MHDDQFLLNVFSCNLKMSWSILSSWVRSSTHSCPNRECTVIHCCHWRPNFESAVFSHLFFPQLTCWLWEWRWWGCVLCLCSPSWSWYPAWSAPRWSPACRLRGGCCRRLAPSACVEVRTAAPRSHKQALIKSSQKQFVWFVVCAQWMASSDSYHSPVQTHFHTVEFVVIYSAYKVELLTCSCVLLWNVSVCVCVCVSVRCVWCSWPAVVRGGHLHQIQTGSRSSHNTATFSMNFWNPSKT